MKVAFILVSLENRGPIIFTKYLIDALKPLGVYIEVFYLKEKPIHDCIDLGVSCKKIALYKRCDFSNFDIVHSTMALPDLYCLLYVSKKKWVVSMHNYIIEDSIMRRGKYRGNLIAFIWRNVLKKAKSIIVSSKAMKVYYQKQIGEKKYYIIPYGIPELSYGEICKKDREKIEKFKTNGYIVLGSVGLLLYRKGFSQIIDILKKNSKYAAVIVGEGPDRLALEKLAQKYNVTDRLFLTGFRNNSYNYYKYIDIYMHVSYSEGFGLAMLEALSKGIPVVCSRLEIYDEYFKDGKVAYFEPGNIDSLEVALTQILNRRDEYSIRSRDVYEKSFKDEIMAKRHLDIYEKISKHF